MSQGRKEPLPAPPNGTISGRRPSTSRDGFVTNILTRTCQEHSSKPRYRADSEPGETTNVRPGSRVVGERGLTGLRPELPDPLGVSRRPMTVAGAGTHE